MVAYALITWIFWLSGVLLALDGANVDVEFSLEPWWLSMELKWILCLSGTLVALDGACADFVFSGVLLALDGAYMDFVSLWSLRVRGPEKNQESSNLSQRIYK